MTTFEKNNPNNISDRQTNIDIQRITTLLILKKQIIIKIWYKLVFHFIWFQYTNDYIIDYRDDSLIIWCLIVLGITISTLQYIKDLRIYCLKRYTGVLVKIR